MNGSVWNQTTQTSKHFKLTPYTTARFSIQKLVLNQMKLCEWYHFKLKCSYVKFNNKTCNQKNFIVALQFSNLNGETFRIQSIQSTNFLISKLKAVKVKHFYGFYSHKNKFEKMLNLNICSLYHSGSGSWKTWPKHKIKFYPRHLQSMLICQLQLNHYIVQYI